MNSLFCSTSTISSSEVHALSTRPVAGPRKSRQKSFLGKYTRYPGFFWAHIGRFYPDCAVNLKIHLFKSFLEMSHGFIRIVDDLQVVRLYAYICIMGNGIWLKIIRICRRPKLKIAIFYLDFSKMTSDSEGSFGGVMYASPCRAVTVTVWSGKHLKKKCR